jgi:hypothetical protein
LKEAKKIKTTRSLPRKKKRNDLQRSSHLQIKNLKSLSESKKTHQHH